MSTSALTSIRFTDRHLARLAKAFPEHLKTAEQTPSPLAEKQNALATLLPSAIALPSELVPPAIAQELDALSQKAQVLSGIDSAEDAEPMAMLAQPTKPDTSALLSLLETVPVSAHHEASINQCLKQVESTLHALKKHLSTRAAPYFREHPHADVYYLPDAPTLQAALPLLASAGRPALSVLNKPRDGEVVFTPINDGSPFTVRLPAPSEDVLAWDRLLNEQLNQGPVLPERFPLNTEIPPSPRTELDQLGDLAALAKYLTPGASVSLPLTLDTAITINTAQGLRTQLLRELSAEHDHLIVANKSLGNYDMNKSGIRLPSTVLRNCLKQNSAGCAISLDEQGWVAHAALSAEELAAQPALPPQAAQQAKRLKVEGFIADLQPEHGYLQRKYNQDGMAKLLTEHHLEGEHETAITGLKTLLEQTSTAVFSSLDVQTDPSQGGRPYYVSLTLHSINSNQLNSRNVAVYLNEVGGHPILPSPHILSKTGLTAELFNVASRSASQFDGAFARAWNNATRNKPGIIASSSINHTLGALGLALPEFARALDGAKLMNTQEWLKRHSLAASPAIDISVTLPDGSKPKFMYLEGQNVGLRTLLTHDQASLHSRDLRFEATRNGNKITVTDTLGHRGEQILAREELAYQVRKGTKRPNYNEMRGSTQALLQSRVAGQLASDGELPERVIPHWPLSLVENEQWTSALQPFSTGALPDQGYFELLAEHYDFSLSTEENIERLAQRHPVIDTPLLTHKKGDSALSSRALLLAVRTESPSLYHYALMGSSIRDPDINNKAKNLPTGSGVITMRPWLRAYAAQVRAHNPAHQRHAERLVVAESVIAHLDISNATLPDDVAERLSNNSALDVADIQNMYQAAYALRDRHGNSLEGLLPATMTGALAWDGTQSAHDMLLLAQSARAFPYDLGVQVLNHCRDMHIKRVIKEQFTDTADQLEITCDALKDHGSAVQVTTHHYLSEPDENKLKACLNRAIPSLLLHNSLGALPERPLGLSPEQEQSAVEQLLRAHIQPNNEHAMTALTELCKQLRVTRLAVSNQKGFSDKWAKAALTSLSTGEPSKFPVNHRVEANELSALAKKVLEAHQEMARLGLCSAHPDPRGAIKLWLRDAAQSLYVVKHVHSVTARLKQGKPVHVPDHPKGFDGRLAQGLVALNHPPKNLRYQDAIEQLLDGVPENNPMHRLNKKAKGTYSRPTLKEPLARLAFDELKAQLQRAPLLNGSELINGLYDSLPHKSQNAFKSVWDSPELSKALSLDIVIDEPAPPTGMTQANHNKNNK